MTSPIGHRLAGFTVATIALGGALGACGGGGGGNATPPAPVASSAGTQPAGKIKVTFVIDAPKSTASAKSRSTQYISPSTTQLLVNIEQNSTSVGSYPVTVALTPTSAGCTATLASTTCQLSVLLNTGAYTATLTAEDSGGNALSSAQNIAFTVTTIPVTVPLTLSGVPASLHVASGAYAVHGAGTSGFTLYGTAAQPVIVTALDADGNTIVGPGAPTYSAALASGTGWSASTPASTTPNTISITPPGTNGSGATFTVTANYNDGGATCALSNAVCTTSFTIKNDIQTLFVADGVTNNTVTQYAPPYTGAPNDTTSTDPYALLLDKAGNLFVANWSTGTVSEYAPPYTGAATTTINSGLSGADALALDASGNLYVSYAISSTVAVYAPPYSSVPTATITNGINYPYLNGLQFDFNGNLFVANYNGMTVTEYAAPYTGSPLRTLGTGTNRPVALTLDPAGDLFIAAGNDVLEYAPPYSGAATSLTNGVAGAYSLALDSAANLFVANTTNNTVTEYAAPYTGAPITTITTGLNQPSVLTIDGAGNLFVANVGSNTVTEYAPPYTGAATATISNGVATPLSLLLTP